MSSSIVPIPKQPIHIRAATVADVAFMDGLQKQTSRQVGYFPTKQFEGYVLTGGVLVAEADGVPVGYCISRDRYLKRDELGVVYQLNVAPAARRMLVGACLLRAAFERAAYGCRLFCCWCAQDIDANRFWEAMGFVPVAFRIGSRSKGKGGAPRLHIFWQKRICEGDAPPNATPWWFPFQTSSGAIRADRVVLPIPPGVHWSEVRAPEVLEVARASTRLSSSQARPRLTAPKKTAGETPAARKRGPGPGPGQVGILVGGRIKYVDRPGYVVPAAPCAAAAPSVPLLPAPVKKKRVRQPAEKIDPKFLAAARELRDRWLEHVNSGHAVLESSGKYDVARALSVTISPVPMLPAA